MYTRFSLPSIAFNRYRFFCEFLNKILVFRDDEQSCTRTLRLHFVISPQPKQFQVRPEEVGYIYETLDQNANAKCKCKCKVQKNISPS